MMNTKECVMCGVDLPAGCRKDRKYCDECKKEKVRECKRKWREQNPEKVREYKRKWDEQNPEKEREYNRKWREQNPEKVRERKRKWRDDIRGFNAMSMMVEAIEYMKEQA